MLDLSRLNINVSSSGSSGRVRGGAEKHEIYAAAFGGHLFYDLFSQGQGGPWPLAPPPDPLLVSQTGHPQRFKTSTKIHSAVFVSSFRRRRGPSFIVPCFWTQFSPDGNTKYHASNIGLRPIHTVRQWRWENCSRVNTLIDIYLFWDIYLITCVHHSHSHSPCELVLKRHYMMVHNIFNGIILNIKYCGCCWRN